MTPDEQDAVVARTVRELRAAKGAHSCYQAKLNQTILDLERAWQTLARQVSDSHPETVEQLDYPSAEEALSTLHKLRKQEQLAKDRKTELDNMPLR